MCINSKVFFSALFIVAFIFSINAQEKPNHAPKVYVSKTGKLFWNKKIPVYLKISASPDDTAKSYLLKSKLTPKYANPFYFDTEGDNFIRTRWAVDPNTGKTIEPKIEVQWDVHNDSKPPVTKVKFKSRYLEKNNVLYFKNNICLYFNTRDESAGTESTLISINNQNYEYFTQDSLLIQDEGKYKFKYYSVDRVGNVENTNYINSVLDNTAPSTELSTKGDVNENVFSPKSSIMFSATDELSGLKNIYYRIDGGSEQIYKSEIKAEKYDEGEHTIKYYSIDNIGNIEEPQEYVFYIDKKAPLITYEAVGDRHVVNGKEFSSGRTKIKLNAFDNKAGVQAIYYSVNNEPYQKYEKPFYLNGKGGARSIKFYGVDNVGNKNMSSDNSTKNISTPYLDLSGPKVRNKFLGKEFVIRDTLFISPKTKIQLDAEDSEAGVQKITYTINDGEEIDYTSPFTIEKEGFYSITQTAYDNVNNTNFKNFFFILDATGPEVYATFSLVPVSRNTVDGEEIGVYPAHTELYLAATDEKVGNHHIYYSLNGSADVYYNAPIKGFEHGKIYNLKIKSYDYLGNVTEKNIKFEVAKSRH